MRQTGVISVRLSQFGGREENREGLGMQTEFSVRVEPRVARVLPDGGVRQKADWAMAESRRRLEQAERGKLLTRTIETLRAVGRARASTTRLARRGRP